VTAAKNEPMAAPWSLRVFLEGGTVQLVARPSTIADGSTLEEIVRVCGLISGALVDVSMPLSAADCVVRLI
jgi:hypothetical protein